MLAFDAFCLSASDDDNENLQITNNTYMTSYDRIYSNDDDIDDIDDIDDSCNFIVIMIMT